MSFAATLLKLHSHDGANLLRLFFVRDHVRTRLGAVPDNDALLSETVHLVQLLPDRVFAELELLAERHLHDLSWLSTAPRVASLSVAANVVLVQQDHRVLGDPGDDLVIRNETHTSCDLKRIRQDTDHHLEVPSS